MRFLSLAALLASLVSALAVSFASAAETVTVTDVAGRSVTVKAPVERVILGEGRQIYLVAALDRDDPSRRVVGWRDDLSKADPLNYKAYVEKFPRLATLPTFGGMKEGVFDVEQAVTLKPDVLFMNIEAKVAVEEARLVETLSSVGIPVVYVDFREKPFENTETSMRLMGKLFGKEEVAEEFIAYRAKEIARVTDRLKQASLQKPLVMVDRAGGYSDTCCMSFGRENFGLMVEIAGGRNLAADLIPGTFGVVNPEQIVSANPDVVIVTGASWDAYVPGGAWVGVGPGADEAEARRKLANLMTRPAFTGVNAVRTGRVHAIWHQFYNSPYQFVAIQAIAKWLHPEIFRDLDPGKTMAELHERFLPLAYRPGYWVSLEARQ
ncbi:ABC transporter substrate-binding protein [Chelatococcus sp. SYSU_G07232]|uniref:ABC transporter substrate-binding protein n=1 Tax=Chelatococcus albus TaxID=3047466 RepID=A0ABT7ABB6_9HYPH|nr:ABC transporter substrate-binding protein [Chelatococcus sp. SYSU_G07232]MDJ1156649.1 ABC transporter substrate-binding protein [Chelatococcus sp. SYSU_G07232]